MTNPIDAGRTPTRKLKGRARRALTLSTKITPQEMELISAASETAGRALGEWVREAILKEAHGLSVGSDQLMTEIVGLQLFLTNVLSPIACGEQMTPGQYEELMQRVKSSKHCAAREVIAQHRAESKEHVRD